MPVAELEKDEVLDDYAAAGLKYIAIPWMQVEPESQKVQVCVDQIRAIAER